MRHGQPGFKAAPGRGADWRSSDDGASIALWTRIDHHFASHRRVIDPCMQRMESGLGNYPYFPFLP